MTKLFKSKIFWLVLIIIVIIAGLVIWTKIKSGKTEYVTTKVTRGEIVQTVSATGTVKAASEIDLNFKIIGKIIALRVKVGDQVKAGQLLAQLEGSDLAVNVSKAAANQAAAQADLDRLLAGATTEEIATLEATVKQKETDWENAQQDLENTKLTYNQDLENKQQTALSDVNTALTKAEIALQTINDTLNFKNNPTYLVVTDATKKQQAVDSYNLAKTKVTDAKADYQQVRENLNDDNLDQSLNSTLNTLNAVSSALDKLADALDYALVTKDLTQTDLDTLKSNTNTQRTTIDSSYDTVQTAKQDVEDAQVTYRTKVDDAAQAVATAEKALSKAQADLFYKKAKPRSEDVAYYQAKVKQAQADLSYAQSKFNETILTAPVAGIITKKNKNLGEQAELSKPVFSLQSLGNYEVEVDIPESDIVKIKLNDPVTITLDALAEEDIFAGVITKIDPAQTEIQDVIYYQVTIMFASEQPANLANLMAVIKPGMTANVTVATNKKGDVLIVPQRAVKEVNGQKAVSVLAAGKPQEKTVVVGLRGDEGLIEVVSGLAEGEEVVTFAKKK